jgi:Zn-dependent protease
MKAGQLLIGLGIGLLVLMLLFPGSHGGMFFWMFILLGIYLLFLNFGRKDDEAGSGCGSGDEDDAPKDPAIEARFNELAGQVLEVTERSATHDTYSFEGCLTKPAREASQLLESKLTGTGHEFFLEAQGRDRVRAVFYPVPIEADPAKSAASKRKFPLHWLLFGLTFLTTTWAGALHQGVDLLRDPSRFMVGLPYALGLLLILGAHEMGHYLTARRYSMQVTPPYFIPVPFGLGTFGAFISMKSVPRHRQALFDVAVAGPLAGLLAALPALLIGLPLSRFVPDTAAGASMMGGGANLGSSILLALVAKLSVGTEIAASHTVQLHPLAFAGWLGLLLTALNLLPIGQLDGGHIAQALFGRIRAGGISRYSMLGLFLLALFVWPGLLFFAILVFFVAGRTGIPPRNDLEPVRGFRRALGFGAFALLLLIVLPLPHALFTEFGLHCPYV